jgi:chemotaxis protein histidine kinase CheA
MSAAIEIVETPVFNASFAVTDLLMKTLENAAKNVAIECVKTCATHYSFDAEEAIKMLGLENLALTRKLMAKRVPGAKKEKAAAKPKAKKESVFPLPFCSELVNSSCCQGLAYNRGLFTQCTKKQMENGSYCNACQADADSNASGIPTCGNIQMRLATGLYEYKDTKGRSPISYAKILLKLKLTQDSAIEAAEKAGALIDEEHFQIKEKSKKASTSARGRPKKANSQITADGAGDLFAQLKSDSESSGSDSESEPAKAKKTKLSDEEKAAKKAALELERAEKKAARDAELAEKKAAREAELAEKKAERDAKLAQEKAEREAKRIQEKAEKEAKKAAELAEKEAKKAAKQAEKESKKNEKESKKKPAAAAPAPAPTPAPVTEEKPEKVRVTRVKIDGVDYLKSSTNILYNPATREEVALYDPITKTVVPLPEEEEDEEEYESEDEN